MPQTQSAAIVLPPREGFGPAQTGAIGAVVHRLARIGPYRAIVFGPPQTGPVFDDVEYVPVHSRKSLFRSATTAYAEGVSKAIARRAPDLIEVHNRPEVASLLAARFRRTPVALFLHNDPQAMRALRRPQDRGKLLHDIARVVTVSGFLRMRLAENVHLISPVPVLPNCIDLAALPPRVAAAERRPVFLFVGRVVADKGADVFVDACAAALPRLPGWTAEIVGADRFSADSRDTPFLRRLRPRAEAAGVAMLGYRTHGEVVEALSEAAVAVVPSRWQEPFGLAALEALACGAALICSPRGGLPEVAGEAALFAEPDPSVLAQAMIALAGDPGRRAALAAAGLRRARQFDTGAIASRLNALRAGILRP